MRKRRVVSLTGPMAQPIALAGALLDRDALAVAQYATDGIVAEEALRLLKRQARRDAARWAEREYTRLRRRGKVKTALFTVLAASRSEEERAAYLVI